MISCFFLGAFCGALVVAAVAAALMRGMEKWFNRRLDYWAGRVTEAQEHINELDTRLREDRDSADWWRGDGND